MFWRKKDPPPLPPWSHRIPIANMVDELIHAGWPADQIIWAIRVRELWSEVCDLEIAEFMREDEVDTKQPVSPEMSPQVSPKMSPRKRPAARRRKWREKKRNQRAKLRLVHPTKD